MVGFFSESIKHKYIFKYNWYYYLSPLVCDFLIRWKSNHFEQITWSKKTIKKHIIKADKDMIDFYNSFN
jgi:hypothetical protein